MCSKGTGVSSCALALLWTVAFAPTMGRSGFAIMMFNSFQKIEEKKKGSFCLTVMQLIPY